MSDSSDDKLLSDLRRAAAFMQAVRVTQAESEKRFKGPNFLSLEQEEEIIDAARNSALVAAVKEHTQVDGGVNYLAERFEEMCRRQRMEVSKELRPAVVKLLATELLVNQKALDRLPVEKLIPVTASQGGIVPELKKEFGHFSAWTIENAVKYYPGHPRGYLSKVDEESKAIANETEFERFRKAPGIFEDAAARYPSNPRAYVREKIKTMDAILKEPEFEHLHKRPDIVSVAVCSTHDPRAFLRKERRWQTRIEEKPEESATPPRQL
jgi:hypothetical protein